jgi:hypothetical protein
VTELVVRSNSGTRSLLIRSDDDRVDYWIARLSAESIEATRRFYALGQTGLGGFFDDLAAQWRGWTGDKTWAALEGDVSIVASHDGLGTVSLLVSLRDEPALRPEQPEWQASPVLAVDAGGLGRLAREAKRLA